MSEVCTPRLMIKASEGCAQVETERDDSIQACSGFSSVADGDVLDQHSLPGVHATWTHEVEQQPLAEVNGLPRGGGAVASVHHMTVCQRSSQQCVAILLRAVTPAGDTKVRS